MKNTSAFGYKESSIVGNVDTINTDIDVYSPDELSKILQLKEITKESIIENTNKYIKKFQRDGNTKLERFFKRAQFKLISSLPRETDSTIVKTRDFDSEKDENNEQVDNWFTNQNLVQEEEKGTLYPLGTTDRQQKIDIYDDHHNVMNQDKLAVQHLPNVVQGQINPTLKNTFTRIINIDSKFRLNSVPSTKKQKFRNIVNAQTSQWSSTDYTLNFNDPLKKLLSMKLYSVQIPYSWYSVDSAYGTSCFIMTQLSDPNEKYITGSAGTAILENTNTRFVAVDGFNIIETLGGTSDLRNNIVNFNDEPIEGTTNTANMPYFFVNDTADVIDSNGIRVKVKSDKYMKVLVNAKDNVQVTNGSTDEDIRILDVNGFPTRFLKSDFSDPGERGTFLSDTSNTLLSKLYFTIDKFDNTVTHLSNAASTDSSNPRVREHSPKIIFGKYKVLLNSDEIGNIFTINRDGNVKFNSENTGIDFSGNIIFNEDNSFKNFKTLHTIETVNGNYSPQELISEINQKMKETLVNNTLVTTEVSFFDDVLNSMTLQLQDAKIVAGGTYFDGINKKLFIARYNTDGTLDTSFNSTGIQTISADISDDKLNSVTYRALNGDIIFGGTSFNKVTNRQDFLIGRLNSNGNVDTSFGSRKTGTTTISFDDGDDIITKIVLQNSTYLGNQTLAANIYACGYSYNSTTRKFDFAVAAVTNATTSDGDLLLNFSSDGKKRYQVGNDDDILTDALISEVDSLIVAGYSYDTTDNCYKFAIGKIELVDRDGFYQAGDADTGFDGREARSGSGSGSGFITTHIFDDKTDSFGMSLINMKFYRDAVIPNGVNFDLQPSMDQALQNSNRLIYPDTTIIASRSVDGINADPALRTLKEATFINDDSEIGHWTESIISNNPRYEYTLVGDDITAGTVNSQLTGLTISASSGTSLPDGTYNVSSLQFGNTTRNIIVASIKITGGNLTQIDFLQTGSNVVAGDVIDINYSTFNGSGVEIAKFTINSEGKLSELVLRATQQNIAGNQDEKLGGIDFFPGNKFTFTVGSTSSISSPTYEYVVTANDGFDAYRGLGRTGFQIGDSSSPTHKIEYTILIPDTPSSPTSGTALSQNTYFVSTFTFFSDAGSSSDPKAKQFSVDRMGNVLYPIQMATGYQGSGFSNTSVSAGVKYTINVMPRLWSIFDTAPLQYYNYGSSLVYDIQSDDLNSAGTGIDGDDSNNLSNWGNMPLLNVEKNSQINVGSNNAITEFEVNSSGQLTKFVLLNVGSGYYAGNILSVVYYDIVYKYTITSQDLAGGFDNSALVKTEFTLSATPINPEFLFVGEVIVVGANLGVLNTAFLTSNIVQGTGAGVGSGTSIISIKTYSNGHIMSFDMSSTFVDGETTVGTGFYAGNIIEILYYETKYKYTVTLTDLKNGANNNPLKTTVINFAPPDSNPSTFLAPSETTLSGIYSRANGKIPKIYPNLNNRIKVYNSINGNRDPTNLTYYEDSMRLTTNGDGIGAVCSELIFSNGYTRAIRLTGGRGYNAPTDGSETVTISVLGQQFGTITNTTEFLQEDYVVGGYAFNSVTETYDFALVFFGHFGSILNKSNGGWGTDGKITFAPIPNYHNFLTSLDITLDGKIVAGGYAYNGNNYEFVVIRLFITGALDTSFGTNGVVRTEVDNCDLFLKSIFANVDGRLTIGGLLNKNSNSDIALTRYTANGNIDTTFVNKVNEKTYGTISYNTNTGKATINTFNKYYSLLFYRQNLPFCSPSCGAGPKANNSLGWLMGFRDQEYTSRDFTTFSNSTFTFEGEAVVDTFGPRYFLLIVDDFNTNQINKAIISAENVEKKADIPSYFTSDLTPNPQCDTTNDLYDIPQYLQGRPPQITQAQQYTLNEILKNRKESSNNVLTSPTNSDVFAIIPLKKSGITPGDALIEFSGPIQVNERNYFGPINVEKLRIRLIDDKGNVVNLNGMDWSFSIITEHLYQY